MSYVHGPNTNLRMKSLDAGISLLQNEFEVIACEHNSSTEKCYDHRSTFLILFYLVFKCVKHLYQLGFTRSSGVDESLELL